MDQNLSNDERNWATVAHLCGLLWLFAGTGLLFRWILGLVNVVIAAIQVRDGRPYRYPFCLRLIS